MLVPMVIEQTPNGERSFDIFSLLNKSRIVFAGTQVEPVMASTIIAQLLYLESVNSEEPIIMYINSPGGYVSAGLAIYDVMQYVKCPVYTIAMGLAASMGSFLLAGGEKGHRYALPNTEIMIHQPSGGAEGKASDIEIQAKNIIATRLRLNQIMAKHTGQPLDIIEKAMDRDNYMTAEEALAFGIIDKIVTKRGE